VPPLPSIARRKHNGVELVPLSLLVGPQDVSAASRFGCMSEKIFRPAVDHDSSKSLHKE